MENTQTIQGIQLQSTIDPEEKTQLQTLNLIHLNVMSTELQTDNNKSHLQTSQVFEIECDPEWEKNLRPISIDQCFTNNKCVYCLKMARSSRKKRIHYFRCKLKDLYEDPFRHKITSAMTRIGRRECKRCLQRFNSLKFRHKCRNLSIIKTLCLYCDKWFDKIRNHKSECNMVALFNKHKDGAIAAFNKKQEIFLKRVDKIWKYMEKKRLEKLKRLNMPPNVPQVLVDKNKKYMPLVNTEKDEEYKREFQKVTNANKRIPYRPWSVPLRYEDHNYVTFLDAFPHKPLTEWTEEQFDYWDKRVDVKLLLRVTEGDKIAAEGLIPMEDFLAKQVYNDGEYTYAMRIMRIEALDCMSDRFIEKERLLFNEIGVNYGILKERNGKINWVKTVVNDKVSAITDPKELVKNNDDVLVYGTPPSDKTNCKIQSIKPKVLFYENYKEIVTPLVYTKQVNSIEQLVNLYIPNFPYVSKSHIEHLVGENDSFCCYKNNVLVGAITFKELNAAGIKFMYVSLVAVDLDLRNQGIGSKLLKLVGQICNRLILWADKNSKGFYKKNDFDACGKFWFALRSVLPRWDYSQFSQKGFTSEELNKIKEWGKTENKIHSKKVNKKLNRIKN
jgi:hypothetical protein